MRTKSLVFTTILILLALAGALILQYGTPIGLGLTNDSQAYLNGARNLLEGNGYGYTSGRGEVKPITHFPPAYAATIAGVSLVSGLEPQRAARLLSLVLLAANILGAALLLWWTTRSRMMAVLGALLVLTSEVIYFVHGFLLQKVVIGLRILPFLPRGRWTDQNHPLDSPAPNPHGFEVGVIPDHGFGMKSKERLLFLFDDHAFIQAGGFDLSQLGKSGSIAGQVQTMAIHPTMVSAFAPTGLLIQMAQFIRNTTGGSIGCMPHRTLRFE